MHYISEYLPSQLMNDYFPELKIEDKQIKFRESSDIQLEKKPCPCMTNKTKELPSS